jgi:hypothetical protein
MKYFEYVARFQTSINIDKEETINHTIHLKNFVEKYSKYNLISKDIFGLEIEEISDKLSTLLNICKDNIMRNRINIPSIEDDIIDDIFGTSLINGPANSPAIPYVISLVVLPVPIPNYPKPNPCIAPLAANFAAPPKVVADAGPRAPVAKADAALPLA